MIPPAATLSEDGLAMMLNRIENRAVEAARLKGVDKARAEAEADLARAARRANEAETKVGEWVSYAEKLRDIIASGQRSGADKRRRIVLPKMPKPLETEIPF